MDLSLNQRPSAPREPAALPASPLRDVAMLAHDIRGALGGVIGGIYLIEAATLESETREQVERVAEAGKMLSCLIAALLGEELSTEKQEAHGNVDLRRFLSDVKLRWSGEAREKSHDFQVEINSDLPFGVRVEPVLLARVLGNLIGNAFNQPSGGTTKLAVERDAGGGLLFRIVDSGPGLSEEVLGRFCNEVYRSTGSTRLARGLGLQIARGITAQLGGTFSIGNREAGGAEAVVRFPPELCIANAPTCIARDSDPARPVLRGTRVLLAEDNLTNQLVAKQMLRALGAEVVLTSDGVAALDRFEKESFDLVLVDIEMPRLSGLDVIRIIRKRPDHRARVPIVALTAYAMREHRDRIFDAGASGLISKPITSIRALGRELMQHVAARAPSVPAPESPEAQADDRGRTEPVVDMATYDALSEAIGPEMVTELLEKVLADLNTNRRQLEEALESVERNPVRAASHILISVAGAIGAMRLTAVSRELNNCARSGSDDEVSSRALGCIREIDAATEFVNERLNER